MVVFCIVSIISLWSADKPNQTKDGETKDQTKDGGCKNQTKESEPEETLKTK